MIFVVIIYVTGKSHLKFPIFSDIPTLLGTLGTLLGIDYTIAKFSNSNLEKLIFEFLILMIVFAEHLSFILLL